MTPERKNEILFLVDRYNRAGNESPFMARHNGRLSLVAEKIDVPVKEIDEFLTLIDRELPAVGEL